MLSKHISKKTSKLRVTGLCVGNSPGTGEFPAQKASNAENVSIWWRHHVMRATGVYLYKLTTIQCHCMQNANLVLHLFFKLPNTFSQNVGDNLAGLDPRLPGSSPNYYIRHMRYTVHPTNSCFVVLCCDHVWTDFTNIVKRPTMVLGQSADSSSANGSILGLHSPKRRRLTDIGNHPRYKPKTVWRTSRVYNGNSYTSKTVSSK